MKTYNIEFTDFELSIIYDALNNHTEYTDNEEEIECSYSIINKIYENCKEI